MPIPDVDITFVLPYQGSSLNIDLQGNRLNSTPVERNLVCYHGLSPTCRLASVLELHMLFYS